MATINPYLNFPGKTEEAFNFYKSVFGGEFMTLMRWKDNPDCKDWPESEKEAIMHVALPVGNDVLMASDFAESLGQKLSAGNNFAIAISPESKEEADRLFNGLSADGTGIMPLQDTFWGAYYGQLTDKFGIQWMVNYTYKEQHKEAVEEEEKQAV